VDRPVHITRIEADANAVYFYGDAFPNAEGCTSAAAVKFDGSDALVDRAVSIGVAAKAAGLRVRFYTNGCSSESCIRAYSTELMD
jgi:hypothetical protein